MSTSSVEKTSARSVSSSAPSWVESTVWCGPPAVSQPSVAVEKSGRGCHTARATGSLGSGSSGSATAILVGAPPEPAPGQPGQRLVGLDDVDLVGDPPEPVAEVGPADDDARGGGRGEHQPRRVL